MLTTVFCHLLLQFSDSLLLDKLLPCVPALAPFRGTTSSWKQSRVRSTTSGSMWAGPSTSSSCSVPTWAGKFILCVHSFDTFLDPFDCQGPPPRPDQPGEHRPLGPGSSDCAHCGGNYTGKNCMFLHVSVYQLILWWILTCDLFPHFTGVHGQTTFWGQVSAPKIGTICFLKKIFQKI